MHRTAGAEIRRWVIETPFQTALEQAIKDAFVELQAGNDQLAVAVRSSATAEDLPDASFAGQQETMLNVRIDQVMLAIKEVFASLFNDRAISYRIKGLRMKKSLYQRVFNKWCAVKPVRV